MARLIPSFMTLLTLITITTSFGQGSAPKYSGPESERYSLVTSL